MLGFEKDRSPIKGEFAKELLDRLQRHVTGNYNNEDLEQLHDKQITPRWEIVDGDNPDSISNFCDVCDLHRNRVCKGKHHSCDSFMNHYDFETCQYCKHGRQIKDDVWHVACPIKNDSVYIKHWCVKFDKK